MLKFIEGPPRFFNIELPSPRDIPAWYALLDDFDAIIENPPETPGKLLALRSVCLRLAIFGNGLLYEISQGTHDETYSREELRKLHARILKIQYPLMCLCPASLAQDGMYIR